MIRRHPQASVLDDPLPPRDLIADLTLIGFGAALASLVWLAVLLRG